jgi:hypothetical protein
VGCGVWDGSGNCSTCAYQATQPGLAEAEPLGAFPVRGWEPEEPEESKYVFS